LPRHVQTAWDALEAGGVSVHDPRGERYDPGMAVNPVTYIPDASVPPNTIVETLKPSVFWKDVLVQRADVILAAPAEKTAKDSGSSPPQEETGK
jgi:molecular chaperone GrpE (heat shock protein)